MSEFRQHKLSDEQNALIDKFQKTLPDKPVDIVALAENFGLEVWRSDMSPRISGSIRKEEKGYAIYANQNEPKARRRFTYAHELSHYLLHRERIGDGINENVLFRNTMENWLEIEANKLAADILMPMKMLNKLAETRKYSVDDLAEFFDVPRSAILVRLGIPR